jgi:predicted nucleic acid binding AN1-type Zn finger protein
MVNCKYLGCKNKISKIIGVCKHCDKGFCSQHRLPETHQCIKLIEIKMNEKQALMTKLYKHSITQKKLTQI